MAYFVEFERLGGLMARIGMRERWSDGDYKDLEVVRENTSLHFSQSGRSTCTETKERTKKTKRN
jgi:hypothetical protein